MKKMRWWVAFILTGIYVFELILFPQWDPIRFHGLKEYFIAVLSGLTFAVGIPAVALIISLLIALLPFSESTYRERVMNTWPIIISLILSLLILFSLIVGLQVAQIRKADVL